MHTEGERAHWGEYPAQYCPWREGETQLLPVALASLRLRLSQSTSPWTIPDLVQRQPSSGPGGLVLDTEM